MNKKQKLLVFLFVPVLIFSFSVLTWYVVKARNLGAKDSAASSTTSTVKITYIVEGNGKIEGKKEQEVPVNKQTTPVIAIADDGYYFSGWSDGETRSQRRDLALKNRTIKAVFKKDFTNASNVQYFTTEGGRVEYYDNPKGEERVEQNIPFKGWGKPVKAVPDDGYEFRGWSDGVEYHIRKDRGNGRDRVYRAYFQEKGREKYKIKYTIEPPGYGEFYQGDIYSVQYLYPGEQGDPVEFTPYDFVNFRIWSDGTKNTYRLQNEGRNIDQKKVALLESKYEKPGTLVHYSIKIEGDGEPKNDWDCGYIDGQNIQLLRQDIIRGKYVVARELDERCKFVGWERNGEIIKTGVAMQEHAKEGEYYRQTFAVFKKEEGSSCGAEHVTVRYGVHRPNQGYIDGERVQNLSNSCSYGRVIRAVPYKGYEFSHWYDNETKERYFRKSPLLQYKPGESKWLIAIFKKTD
ncbi:MAG: InlB B-repeat-containing protein [Candidatus Dojkabacteria bacterium]|jgi:hypothetical protein